MGHFNVLVAGSDDGRTIVAGSDLGIIRLYDQTGKTLWTYNVTGKAMNTVAISGNGENVVAGFMDPYQPNGLGWGEIIYFNRSGSILWRYSTNASVQRVAISDNGNLVFASGDSKLYFFDRNGTRTGTFDTLAAVWSAAIDSDGTRGVAGGAYPGNAIYLMAPDGTLVLNYTIGSDSRGIHDVDISRTGNFIAGVDDNHVILLDHEGNLLWDYNRSTSYARVALSSDGEYTAATSQYYIRYFNRTGSLLWEYYVPAYVNDIAVSGSGDRVFAGTSTGLYLFNRSGHPVWKNNLTASSLSVAKDGGYYIAGDATTVYYFNREGASASPVPAAIPASIANPHENTHMQGKPLTDTTPSLTLSAAIPLIALVLVGIVAFRWKKQR